MQPHRVVSTFNHLHACASKSFAHQRSIRTLTNRSAARRIFQIPTRVGVGPSKPGTSSPSHLPRKFARLSFVILTFICMAMPSHDRERSRLWVDFGAIQGIVVRAKPSIGPGSNHKAVPLVDLGFDIHLSGRAAKPLHAEVVRELTQSDLHLLATERGVQPSHVQRITDRHHALARCLASGMSATEAGLCTGYTGSRISILRGDPAFEELISFYRADKGKAVEDLQSKFTALAKDATTVLQDRLEDDPDKFVVAELLDVVKLAADRSGNGPQSKTTNVNVNVNLGDRMKAARERVAALSPPGDRDTGAKAISHETALAPSFIEGTFTEIIK